MVNPQTTDAENGINGATGEYLFPALGDRHLATQARTALTRRTPQLTELQNRANLAEQTRAVAAWVDATDLAKAGWGVIFAQDYPQETYDLEALLSDDGLGLLLRHRQAQAAQENEKYYRHCTYKPSQDKAQFLKAHKVPTSGAVDPDRGMPYYLLIVGDPASIPYEFQYQLDVQYAVGRIYFDKLENYAHYAQSVVRAETEPVQRPQVVQFWGVSNTGDRATQLSAKSLITPLDQWVREIHPTWATELLIKDSATKANLDRILNQNPAPALLFTASHGVGYPPGDPHQRDYQGALVTQDWSRFDGAPDPENHLFAAADLQANADLHGLIAFHFACYGLGTPQRNSFRHRDGEAVGKTLAEQPLISKLPQALLSHPNGGALAVIGHVDRAFSDSFKSSGIKQWSVFQSVLTCLMKHCPVGYALEFFNQQYAELASDCSLGIQNEDKTDRELAQLWTTSNNARNYAIFGDPAVRAAVAPRDVALTADQTPTVWFQTAEAAQPTGRINPALMGGLTNLTPPDRQAQLEATVEKLVHRVEALEQRLEALENSPDQSP